MGSKVSFAKTTLGYPLFAAEFDPYNRGYLVVGGGGGESKTGVPNQISVLDVSNRAKITIAVEIDLSRDEDSVQSLGSLATKDGLITFAGINSSQANQNAGKNEHLRAFDIRYPPRKRQKTETSDAGDQRRIEPIGKRSLFKRSTAAKSETYQRLLRLSQARRRDGGGSKRIGAVATGMAKDGEIVVFDATSATPTESDILARIDLPEGDEAADLDVSESETSEFSLAYSTDYDLYEQTYAYDFATKKVDKRPNGPRRVHQMPYPDASDKVKSRSKFRSVRFLNSQNVITLSNRPNKSGTDLRIFHLYPTGPANLVLVKSLPSRIKSAVSLDVCALDADKAGNQQVAIAVAGQDISIEIYVTNYQRATDTFSPFKSYLTLRDVHEHQITKLCFSAFHSPSRAPDAEPAGTDSNGQPVPEKKVEVGLHPGPQYIRLASVSYGNTVVVDTLPLQPLEPQNKRSRYVLSHPSDEKFTMIAYVSVITMIVLVTAFLLQSFLTGFSEGNGGVFGLLPYSWREFLDKPAAAARGAKYTLASKVESSVPSNLPVVKARLRDLLASRDTSGSKNALVVRSDADSTGVSVDVHPDAEAYVKEDTKAMHWEQMDQQQREGWKARLVQAGEWAESEGESVLKGILFSGYAGAIGQMAAGVVGA
ncbi:hypothetical protein LTR53_001614 [Teratosphaeriaceae sp. CCFEE 6253]|nr:hypothetical protein LTR53_001614 [Teratosphaeriaceae sp. CCFEE 6253]